MKFLGIRFLRGPSLFADFPCTYASVAFPCEEQDLFKKYDSNVYAAANSLLPRIHPELINIISKVTGEPLFIEIVTALTIFALEKLDLNHDGAYITKDASGEIIKIVFPSTDINVVRQAIQLSLQVATRLHPDELSRHFPDIFRTPNTLANYSNYLGAGKLAHGKSNDIREIQLSLSSRSIQWLPLDHYPNTRDRIQIGYGRYQQILDRATSFESSMLGINISMSKLHSHLFLSDLGFPLPKYMTVSTLEQARRAAVTIGYPVVVKGEYGAHGDYVYSKLKNEVEVVEAFNSLKKKIANSRFKANTIIVEEFIEGNDYRITIARGSLLGASHRIPAKVVGNGRNTVYELIEIENRNPLRGPKGASDVIYRLLQLKEHEIAILKTQELTPASVPSEGTTVWLRENANVSSGGTFEDVSDIIHPDNITLAVRIANAMKIDLMGIDGITKDISKSFLEGELHVIEVNHDPLLFHRLNESGALKHPAAHLIDLMAPLAVKNPVPIAIITKSPLSQLITEQIGKALTLEGFSPGVVNKSGMFVNSHPWAMPHSLDYRDPAYTVLRNQEIDAAVLEREFNDLAIHGLGTGGCDCSVIMSIPDQAIFSGTWPNDITPFEVVKTLIRNSRKRSAVLMDDPNIAERVNELDASKLCILSTKGWSQTIEQLVNSGSGAVLVKSATTDSLELIIVTENPDGSSNTLEARIRNIDPVEENTIIAVATLGALLGLGLPIDRALQHFKK